LILELALSLDSDFAYKVTGDVGGAVMTNVDFATLVRLIRRTRGQTQEELARELDVTVGTMNGWENGKHRPVKAQRRRLMSLADEIGLSIPEIDSRTGVGGSE
jgi:transcriptional regulator with XRE-family HTH domain